MYFLLCFFCILPLVMHRLKTAWFWMQTTVHSDIWIRQNDKLWCFFFQTTRQDFEQWLNPREQPPNQWKSSIWHLCIRSGQISGCQAPGGVWRHPGITTDLWLTDTNFPVENGCIGCSSPPRNHNLSRFHPYFDKSFPSHSLQLPVKSCENW